jgi:kynurenine formamidase
MMISSYRLPAITALSACVLSCATPKPSDDRALRFTPSEVIDLGASVTADLPERLWGKAFLKQMGFVKQNSFDVIHWKFPVEGDTVSGSNAYYTLFNHGGPHVDAPNHVGAGGGLDSYPIEAFAGPLKVFDVSSYPLGRSVPVSVFQGHVTAGDIVLILTRYSPPPTDQALPQVITLTHEAAEFLATLPVRAYGTDAFSVESLNDTKMPWIHITFLSRTIPVYEQLFNVDRLIGKQRMFFVGTPLNVKGGDGMIVRPVAFVY